MLQLRQELVFAFRIEFFVIYIREAHPVDAWDVGSENRIYDPQTIMERRQVAGMCKTAVQYGIWTYVDDLDDIVMTAYVAWPERLYLVGIDERVSSRDAGAGSFLRRLPI